MSSPFTLIVSDFHLADAQPVDPRRPHWKAYKRRQFFIDPDFDRFLAYFERTVQGPIELILNGDIFDFDDITQLPQDPPQPISWLARLRGLESEQWMSLFKMECIIAAHTQWFASLRRFIQAGHRIIFVIGNHDLELHWPEVQERIQKELGVGAHPEDPRLVFCEWFYLSGQDTYVSHGHQYDPYCTTKSPLDPLIEVHGRPRIRIPFGDLAGRYLLNGMGYFNPHATENYLMSVWGYIRFFFKHMLRTQPFLLFTWFWSALAALAITMRDFLKPTMRDPLMVEEKVLAAAERSQATPAQVRRLNALHAPSAATSPMKIMRELWLDRGLLFVVILFGALEIMLAINFFVPIRIWWTLLFMALLFPLFLIYSFKVKPGAFHEPLLSEKRANLIAKITGTKHIVFGHTHRPLTAQVGDVFYVNGGFWSAAFKEPQCHTRIGQPTFVQISPDTSLTRKIELRTWPLGSEEPVACAEHTQNTDATQNITA